MTWSSSTNEGPLEGKAVAASAMSCSANVARSIRSGLIVHRLLVGADNVEEEGITLVEMVA